MNIIYFTLSTFVFMSKCLVNEKIISITSGFLMSSSVLVQLNHMSSSHVRGARITGGAAEQPTVRSECHNDPFVLHQPGVSSARSDPVMMKTARMELLRALITQCLSAAAEEIFRIAERTMAEFEEEVQSCSKWVVDEDHRLLDMARTRAEGGLEKCHFTTETDGFSGSGLAQSSDWGRSSDWGQSSGLGQSYN